jgi:hypothetical protein
MYMFYILNWFIPSFYSPSSPIPLLKVTSTGLDVSYSRENLLGGSGILR